MVDPRSQSASVSGHDTNAGAESETDAPARSVLDTEDTGLRARYFRLPHWLQWPTRVCGLALVAFHVVTAWTGALPNFIHRSIHVGVALILVYLLFGTGRDRRPSWHDYLSMALVAASSINIVVSYERIIELGAVGYPSLHDLILGAVLIVIALETGRRTIGPFLPVLGVVFLAYAYFGPWFPGLLGHRGFDLTTILEIAYTTTRGMWGLVTAVIATTIAMFIIFGSTISATRCRPGAEGNQPLGGRAHGRGRRLRGGGRLQPLRHRIGQHRLQRGGDGVLHHPDDEEPGIQPLLRRGGGGGCLDRWIAHAPGHGGGCLHHGRIPRHSLPGHPAAGPHSGGAVLRGGRSSRCASMPGSTPCRRCPRIRWAAPWPSSIPSGCWRW